MSIKQRIARVEQSAPREREYRLFLMPMGGPAEVGFPVAGDFPVTHIEPGESCEAFRARVVLQATDANLPGLAVASRQAWESLGRPVNLGWGS